MRAESCQQSLDLLSDIAPEEYDYGERSSGETHGVVLTKPHVVSLILDLAGYRPEEDLTRLSLLEPSCGTGAFLLPSIERLLSSAQRVGADVVDLRSAVTAFDIDAAHVAETRAAIAVLLKNHGVDAEAIDDLVRTWVVQGDFLLHGLGRRFDVIVGNPPYIRIEQLSPRLQAEYRRRYRSLYDRADLYVAFVEKTLDLLSDRGVLSFICADRWIVNKYGAPLRQMLTKAYHVLSYIDLHTASPFESEVIAYPSIFAVRRGTGHDVNVGALSTGSPEECEAVIPAFKAASSSTGGVTVSRYESWFQGDEPWVITSPDHLDALRSLERRFETIEEGGLARVGIGVATGDDKAYIVTGQADIEADRLVPLVMRADIDGGTIKNAGRFVINTFGPDGKVVDLRDYPRLANYFRQHEVEVKRRHVAKKNPARWFRTIDRVYPELVRRPKLLIPDIAGANEVVFDPGGFHPHHNLYFVTSEQWDLEVLGGLLSSRVALFFIWSYAVKMRGGYLRFQAQYLRRIRVPPPQDVSVVLAAEIRNAFRGRDFRQLDRLALEAYGLRVLPSFDFVDTRG